jgi:hypothetical protein
MIFNQTVIGNHPAQSGYFVECFVRGSEDTSIGFPSGSGRLKIEFPEFSVTGLEFEGKNLLFAPTGSTEEEKLMDSIIVLENEINLKALFSGDLNTIGDGLAIRNIKNADVYTGDEPNFEVDSLGFTNRVAQVPVNLSAGEESFQINVLASDIEDRTEEEIFYKIIPTDFLTFGSESPATSGVMFSGFDTFNKIEETGFLISRTTANDVRVGRDETTIEIFTGHDEKPVIIIDDTIPLDFYASFRIRQGNKSTIISGSGGANIVSSSSTFTVSDNKVSIPNGNEFAEFDIACLLDESNDRTGFILGEL